MRLCLTTGLTVQDEGGSEKTFWFQLASERSSFLSTPASELYFCDLRDTEPPKDREYCGLLQLESYQSTISKDYLMSQAKLEEDALTPALWIVALVVDDLPASVQLVGNCPFSVVFVSHSTGQSLIALESELGALYISISLSGEVLASDLSQEFDSADEEVQSSRRSSETSPDLGKLWSDIEQTIVKLS